MLDRLRAACVAEHRRRGGVGERFDAGRARRSSTSSSSTAARFARERARAAAAGEEPNFVPLVRGWGGVSLVYRKRLQDSPAYRLNHEEVIKALEEGITLRRVHEPGRSGARRVRRGRPCASSDQARKDGSRRDRRDHRVARRGPCWSPPARARTSSTRRRIRARSQLDEQGRVLPGVSASSDEGGEAAAEARSETARDRDSSRRTSSDGRFVTLLRRQPSGVRRQRRQGDGVGQARLSARSSSCSRTSIARARTRRASPARDRDFGKLARDARRRASCRRRRGSSA